MKVLYVHNLKHDTTEVQLQEKFESYGPVERVKKVKGYAFVHFADREAALRAQQELNGVVRWLNYGLLIVTFIWNKVF